MTQPSSAAAPCRLGPYEVRGKIADGGMAAVYVASRDGQLVALKMIRDEFARTDEFLTMFLDEARIVSRLEHPSIVRYSSSSAATQTGRRSSSMELLQRSVALGGVGGVPGRAGCACGTT